MNLLNVVLVLVCAIAYSKAERIRLEAKKLIRGKVVASGYSVPAKSLSNCIEHCNRKKVTCDGIIYHEVIKKCRLISKCAPAYQVDNTSNVVYYSRRPQIMAPGYIYEPKSETCFGLVSSQVNYAEADKICRKQNAQLPVVNRKKVNKIVSNLLTRSGNKWAWIGHESVAYETTIKPHGISGDSLLGNDVLSQEVFSPVVVHWRNSSYRSCWGVNNMGEWGQFSCKNDTMVPLCQVHQFKV